MWRWCSRHRARSHGYIAAVDAETGELRTFRCAWILLTTLEGSKDTTTAQDRLKQLSVARVQKLSGGRRNDLRLTDEHFCKPRGRLQCPSPSGSTRQPLTQTFIYAPIPNQATFALTRRGKEHGKTHNAPGLTAVTSSCFMLITQQMIEQYESGIRRGSGRRALPSKNGSPRDATRAAAKSFATQIEDLQSQLKDQAETSEKLKVQIASESAKTATASAKADAEQAYPGYQQQLDSKVKVDSTKSKNANFVSRSVNSRKHKRISISGWPANWKPNQAAIETRVAAGFQQKGETAEADRRCAEGQCRFAAEVDRLAATTGRDPGVGSKNS